MCKIKRVASLNTEEVVVMECTLVAVVAANDLPCGIGAAHTERGLTAIAACVQTVPTCFISQGRVL